MSNAIFNIPTPVNEPIKSYAPNSVERKLIFEAYDNLYQQKVAIPLFINGEEIFTENTKNITPPHDHH